MEHADETSTFEIIEDGYADSGEIAEMNADICCCCCCVLM